MTESIGPDSTELARSLKVLSDPTRLTIFDALMQGVQCNCDLGERLGLPMNLISHHLKVLRQAGLVQVERDQLDSRWLYYSVDVRALEELRTWLTTFLNPARIQPRLSTCGPRIIYDLENVVQAG
ncbi:MAG: ArsR/SmtB family transcription factor [Anaerolineae bacterium]